MMSVEFIAGLATGEAHFGIAVRKKGRTNYKLGIALLPAFSMDMTDVLVIEEVSKALTHYGIPHWVFRHKTKQLKGIRIHGLRRLRVFLPWIIPHLYGHKREAAVNLLSFVMRRLQLPHQAPYTEEDLGFVMKARSMNGWQGLHRTEDIEEISRILRDYTSDSTLEKI